MSQVDPVASSKRPRPVILGLAAAVVAIFLVFRIWPAASPQPAPSNQPRDQRPVATSATGPGQLDVRLGELRQPPPEPGGDKRNPFRFYVKPPPPAPPPPKPVVTPPPPRPLQPGEPSYVVPPPPPPPPIPLKFMGTMERAGKKWAIFSDGGNVPRYATEGDLVLGQYRVVRIGVESVVMEYADGRGRQTIPMRGQ